MKSNCQPGAGSSSAANVTDAATTSATASSTALLLRIVASYFGNRNWIWKRSSQSDAKSGFTALA
jgi:putative flippase GtrA